jgi:hypothetical protein
MNELSLAAIIVLSLTDWTVAAGPRTLAADRMLFDFEDPADLKAWSNLALPNTKAPEPGVRLELAHQHATSGKHSLKLTFAGGSWPTITTTRIPEDWLAYQTFHADVTVSRPCVVGFTVLQERSGRGEGWEDLVSRWTKTAFLRAGTNHVSAALPQPNQYAVSARFGKVVRFEIFMYRPKNGEAICLDNIRLSTRKEVPPSDKTRFPVAGTDWEVFGKSRGVASAEAVIALGKKLKDRWVRPEVKTVAQIEADFRSQYLALKKKHPHAVLAVLRDGEEGYDPNHPAKVYAGWEDAYFNSHGPDGNYVDRARNGGKSATHEVFMRHRSPLMRLDLSSIPTGSEILAARLIVVRAGDKISGEHDPLLKPTMWVVEPCNRPWKEYEVNAFEYARDRFWHEVGGFHWGPDPDFLPIFLAHGPGQGKVNSWDFTEAIRFWTSGRHANHGFMLHGDSHDYMIACTRETADVKNRPAVLVTYVPK